MQTLTMTNKYQTLGERASGKERKLKWRKRKENGKEKLSALRRKVRKENGGAGEEGLVEKVGTLRRLPGATSPHCPPLPPPPPALALFS